MSTRTPAGEKGTADRVEADDGGYWVRLVTKQALRREGVCMDNCLARGEHADSAGEEEMVSTAIWSLRNAKGVSYMTTSVYAQRSDTFVGNTEGPKGSRPSGLPPEKWSSVRYGLGPCGGCCDAPEEAYG